VNSNLLYELMEKLDNAFPNKLPLESEMLNSPHKVWMSIGSRRVIEYIRSELIRKDD